ncbi:MAG: 30S ribosomal protein S8 [Firmicutes bacterium]|nr:30S ribosomal protein S8 [Bacillota bacterium]
MMNDPIADMLTRVRNANMVRHTSVDIPASRLKRALAQIMKEEGYIKDFDYIENKKQGIVRIYLKYGPDSRRAITGLKRISKPGLRVYANKDELPRVLGGLGVAVISSSRGVISDREARELGCGGEVICYIW